MSASIRSKKRLLFNSPSERYAKRHVVRKSPTPRRSPKKTMNPADMFRVISPSVSPKSSKSVSPKSSKSVSARRSAKDLPDIFHTEKGTLCDWTPNVELFGKGASGTVYKTNDCKECQFMPVGGNDIIFKIETSKNCDVGLADMVAVNNIAAVKGFAPMIHEYKVCGTRNCRLYMDYIPGTTLTRILKADNENLIIHVFDLLFKSLSKLHRILPHGHGDMNFQNVLYVPGGVNGKYNEIVFIDFTVSYVDYRSRHYILDYLQMLYYINVMHLDPGVHIMLTDKTLIYMFEILDASRANNSQTFKDIREDLVPVYINEYTELHAADASGMSDTEILKLEDRVYLKWKSLEGYITNTLLRIAFGIQ